MSRRRLIAANWKMNKTIAEAVVFVPPLRDALPRLSDVDLAVFPSFLGIRPVVDALQGTDVAVGAQDVYFEANGAYTGEVSAAMIRDAGGTMVLVGHSERRHVLGESDETVAKKLVAALQAGLTPVLCVGELISERDAGNARSVVERQLTTAFAAVAAALAPRTVVAYEPVWAIGTGRTASPDDAAEMHAAVRAWLSGRLGNAADGMRILYGGSVKPDNAAGLIARENVDGFLVGGASLDPASFVAIATASVTRSRR
ncbi:MAG TPA: triose-phosphate isomerase [Candidatus Krumholzibacteria bacterium]